MVLTDSKVRTAQSADKQYELTDVNGGVSSDCWLEQYNLFLTDFARMSCDDESQVGYLWEYHKGKARLRVIFALMAHRCAAT